MYFIGVTTGKSSIMQVFPKWAAILGINAQLVGYDAPLQAPTHTYREIVERIKGDPHTAGALVTAHKIDLLTAARDLFDDLDPYANLCREVSCISKRAGRLIGAAKDPISSGLTLEGFVPAGHWSATGAEVLCLGAGGAAIAISVYLAQAVSNTPRRFIAVDVNQTRLDNLRDIHQALDTPMQFEYLLNNDPVRNDRLMAALPAGSLVVNATGMGKDRPGSPVTDAGVFPARSLVWELNYRGDLDFLHQAKHQQTARDLLIEDGWRYFLHGWTQVVAEVFDVALNPALFAQLAASAESVRG
jgi:shikimate 5-dehydrogenase